MNPDWSVSDDDDSQSSPDSESAMATDDVVSPLANPITRRAGVNQYSTDSVRTPVVMPIARTNSKLMTDDDVEAADVLVPKMSLPYSHENAAAVARENSTGACSTGAFDRLYIRREIQLTPDRKMSGFFLADNPMGTVLFDDMGDDAAAVRLRMGPAGIMNSMTASSMDLQVSSFGSSQAASACIAALPSPFPCVAESKAFARQLSGAGTSGFFPFNANGGFPFRSLSQEPAQPPGLLSVNSYWRNVSTQGSLVQP